MRAITPVFSVLLIVILSVALIGFLWLFMIGTFNSLTSSGTSTVGESLTTISSCMKIESAYGNQVSIRNCGKGSITQGTLGAYLDDIPLNVTMSPIVVGEDGVGTVTLSGLWGFNAGRHMLRASNTKVITEVPVDAVLPDSCVLDLEFDEGSGNIARDSSSYNNGTLLNATAATCWTNGACPDWTVGKFGNALQFDGRGDYVDLDNNSILNARTNDFSISAWFKTNGSVDSWSPQDFQHIIYSKDTNNTKGSREIEFGITGKLYWPVAGQALCFVLNECTGTCLSLKSTSRYDDGNWHFMECSFKRTGNATLYVDGEQINTIIISTWSGDDFNSVYNATIGNDVSVTQRFNGTIDSVRAYNQALTPDQTISLKPVSYD
jgi:hypothetical protein